MMEIPLETYASYLPRLIVERLAVHPAPLDQAQSHHFPSAILFADIAGFTALTERLSRKGAVGIEEMTALLNDYFGRLIDLVLAHGGDVLKFAGDALLASWPAENDAGLRDATLRAVQCALEVQAVLRGFAAQGESLALRINIGCGQIRTLEVGGVFGRWELVVSGESIAQFADKHQRASVGGVAVSPAAWTLTEDAAIGQPNAGGGREISQLTSPRPPQPNDPIALHPVMERGLRAYIPGAILSRMSAGQVAWLAEFRPLSVVFVNLPALHHETPVEQAQQVMQILQSSLYHYEGSINKLSVDEKGVTLVAAFGLPPFTHEDDASRALLASGELQGRLRALGAASAVGIATGLVFCGSIGNSARREYTVMGDVVNLAARLMQAAAGGILCDEATRRHAAGRFQFDVLPPLQVKGKRDPQPVFRPQRTTAQLEYATELVGRQTELAVLRTAIAELAQGQGGVVAIEGEPGIGKSRLLQEARRLTTATDLITLIGGGDSVEHASPWHAWRPIFAGIFEIDPLRDELPARRAAVERTMAAHPEWIALTPLLNPVLQLDFPETELTAPMEGVVRADNTTDLLIDLLQTRIAGQSVLLILEDVHWCDSASWSLLWQLSRRIKPCLIILAHRPFDGSSPAELSLLTKPPAARRLRLESLSREETDELACHRLGVRSLPHAVSDWIYSRVEGHPFFCEEMAHALLESDLIRIADGQLQLTCREEHLRTVQFPTTIQGLITSRLDKLSPPQQMVMKTASVIGRVFGFRVLDGVYPIDQDRPHLPDCLTVIAQRNLAHEERPAPDLTYVFKHALIQDVAYNLMLFAQRRKLHQAIAEWYECSSAEELASAYGLLAHHWHEAGVPRKSLEYLELAGDEALRSGAFQEAAAYLRGALEGQAAAQAAPHRTAVLERKLGQACLGLGRLNESLEHSLRAVARLGFPEPPSSLTRLMATIGQVFVRLVRAARPARLAADPDTVLEAARGYEQLAELHYFANNTLRFLHACLRTLNLAERAVPSPELVRAHANMGLTAGAVPLHGVARRQFRKAMETADLVDHPPATAWALLTSGVYHVGVCGWNRARLTVEQGLEICERLGHHRQSGILRTVLGATYFYRGDFQQAAAIWDVVLDRGHRRGDVLHEAWGYGGLAMNHLRLGRLDSCVRHAESALHLFETNADKVSEITTCGVLALAQWRLGHPDAARRAGERAGQMLQERGAPTAYYLLEGQSALCDVFLSAWEQTRQEGSPPDRDTIRAARTAVKSLAAYARIFPVGAARYQIWLGRLKWLTGAPARALAHWHAAIQIATRNGMQFDLALAHLEIGSRSTLPAQERATALRNAEQLFRLTHAAYEHEQADRALANLPAPPH